MIDAARGQAVLAGARALLEREALARAVTVLLLLVLMYLLAQLTWRLLPAAQTAAAFPPASAAAVAAMPSAGWEAAREVPAWHLLGSAAVEPVLDSGALPESGLGLTLLGVIASPSPKVARAIVADASGQQRMYRIGAMLPGDAELREVQRDHVVLRRGGRLETLRMVKEGLNLTGPQPGQPVGGGAGSSLSLRQFRDTLVNNPRQVADLVRAEPVEEGGRFIGYQVQPGRDAQLLSRHGLMPGDIITHVNGMALDSQERASELLRDVADMKTADLEVRRNGVAQHVMLIIE